jgi:hypothetical protein
MKTWRPAPSGRVRAASTLRAPQGTMRIEASVMIEKFATIGGEASSEFLDLNHTRAS